MGNFRTISSSYQEDNYRDMGWVCLISSSQYILLASINWEHDVSVRCSFKRLPITPVSFECKYKQSPLVMLAVRWDWDSPEINISQFRCVYLKLSMTELVFGTTRLKALVALPVTTFEQSGSPREFIMQITFLLFAGNPTKCVCKRVQDGVHWTLTFLQAVQAATDMMHTKNYKLYEKPKPVFGFVPYTKPIWVFWKTKMLGFSKNH